MLYLVGLGLDDGEITEKGVEAVSRAEKAYVEFYTNTETVDVEKLEEETGTEIENLERGEVEQEDVIVNEAAERDVAFLVSGDPLTATTHYDIKHRTEKKDIDVEVIHAPSILTSVAETGLNPYKFGRTVTLPEHASPDSIGEHIEKNDSIDLHTLVLLDINYDASDAAEKLVDIDGSLEGRRIVVLERANADSMSVHVENLGEEFETGEPPHCIAIVGETDHKEEEFLESHDG